jgi:hypothetical protein
LAPGDGQKSPLYSWIVSVGKIKSAQKDSQPANPARILPPEGEFTGDRFGQVGWADGRAFLKSRQGGPAAESNQPLSNADQSTWQPRIFPQTRTI